MLKKLVLALMLTCGLAQAQTTTTYQIGDDGYAFVPLPFSFPFYGQTFNQSWMYDNGIISFLNPNSSGAISPWQWSAPQSLSQTNGKYFIAALWADIAPTNGTTYTTTTDGMYMKYSWNNISEYYSGGTRLSSFSSTIKPDGSVSTSYYSLNLQTSNVLAGTVGDPSLGEVNQVYSAPFGTNITNGSISDWTYKPNDPCAIDPLSSASCPGFGDALAKLTNTSSTSSTTSSTTETPTTTITTTVVDDPISPTVTVTTTSTVSSVTGTPTIATVSSPTPTTVTTTQKSSTSSNSSGTSIGLSVIAKNQQREQTFSMTAVQNAIAGSDTAASQSQQEATSVATQSVTNSTSQSFTGTGLKVAGFSQLNFSGIQTSEVASVTDNVVATNSNMLIDKTNPLNEYVDYRPNFGAISSSNQLVNKNTSDNDLAGGVQLATIATLPVGYNGYLNLAMKDSDFYSAITVYANQRTVDNQRVSRSLFNNTTHKRMMEMQYDR